MQTKLFQQCSWRWVIRDKDLLFNIWITECHTIKWTPAKSNECGLFIHPSFPFSFLLKSIFFISLFWDFSWLDLNLMKMKTRKRRYYRWFKFHPWWLFSTLSVYVNKDLLEHSYTHSFTVWGDNRLRSDCGPQGLKYLPSGLFQKNLAEPKVK